MSDLEFDGSSLWMADRDGVIWLTRDGGQTWEQVTP